MTRQEYHYQTIRDVIHHIIEHRLEQASLEEVSRSFGMSKGYLQKLFTQWVGISPKQFSRYIGLQYAKELLLQNKTTLTTSIGTGLSSEGRLYDAFVDIEAMTPGEYKQKGKGVTIVYSTCSTRFGMCLIASTGKGVCNILFFDSLKDVQADLRSRWQFAEIISAEMFGAQTGGIHTKHDLSKKLQKEILSSHKKIEKYLNSIPSSSRASQVSHTSRITEASQFSKGRAKIKLHLAGTNFQIKVWEALLSIPQGAIATYHDIALRLGDKKLSRAVGMAIGENPIGYIIPCHRVLASTGEISGYRWGTDRKRVMLGYEAMQKQKHDKKNKKVIAEQSSSTPSSASPYYVYIVECHDTTLYIGSTNNLEKRVMMHNSPNRGAKYTKHRQPVTLRYSEVCDSKNAALKREYALKQLTRGEKLKLIQFGREKTNN